MLNIALLIPHLQSGGAERVTALLSKILFLNGHSVKILLFDNENISYKTYGDLINMNLKSSKSLFLKVFIRLFRIVKLSLIKKKYNIDYVISFLYAANVVNYYSVGKSKKILTIRGYKEYEKYGKLYVRFLNKIDKLIVQTDRLKNDIVRDHNLPEKLSRKIKVISNPFDLQQINIKSKLPLDVNTSKKLQTKNIKMCVMGAFKAEKGFDHVVRVFNNLRNYYNNISLIFIGHRGDLEKEISNLAKESEFYNDIIFLGYQSNPYNILSNCDFFILPSISEGFPNSLLEAMACGLPVISTNCPTGPLEILNEGDPIKINSNGYFLAKYGILINTFNVVSDFTMNRKLSGTEIDLFKAIEFLILNQDIRNSLKNLSLSRARNFDLNIFYSKFTSVLE